MIKKNSELNQCKRTNDQIYQLYKGIKNEIKPIFLSTLIICTKNEKFKLDKIEGLLFRKDEEKKKPIKELIKIASEVIDANIQHEDVKNAMKDSLNSLTNEDYNLSANPSKLFEFIDHFLKKLPSTMKYDNGFFIEKFYTAVDKKGKDQQTKVLY